MPKIPVHSLDALMPLFSLLIWGLSFMVSRWHCVKANVLAVLCMVWGTYWIDDDYVVVLFSSNVFGNI